MENTVANYWDKFVGTHINSPDHWEANQVVQQFQWKLITGDPFLNPVDWFMANYGPFSKMASICCGSGILEHHIATNYPATQEGGIDGFDISQGSIDVANSKCRDLSGVSFYVRDVNTDAWESNKYDAIFAHGALHHVESLDFCLGQLSKSLRPSGCLYVNDYVGPRRFQWTDLQLQLSQELFDYVPKQYRRNDHVTRCDAEALRKVDPSEAVCSDEIIEYVEKHFNIIRRIDRGGSILSPIFGSGCINPEIFTTPAGMDIIDQLCAREKQLIDDSVLESNNVVIVTSPKKSQPISSS
jgi:SAM-dependent methyltransferase